MVAVRGTDFAQIWGMAAIHFLSKGQREVVTELLRKLLIAEMGNFTPDRFKEWVKSQDNQFRKMGLMLQFEIHDRVVHFTIKELRSGRRVYHFATSTRVRFDADEVVMSYEELQRRF